MRQRTKLAAALLVVALVLSGVVYGGLELFRNQAQSQAQDQLQQTADVLESQTRESLRAAATDLQVFGSDWDTANYSTVGRSLQSFADHSAFATAVVIDRNWTVIDVRGEIRESARRAAIGSNGSEPYLREAFEDDTIEVRGPVEDGGKYYVTVAATNFGSERRKAGVVGGLLELSAFTAPANALDTDTRAVRITMNNGSGPVTVREASGDFGDPLTANATMEAYGASWTITVLEDQAALNERLGYLTILGGASLLIVLGTVFGLGYWEYTTNLKQTERLLEGFTKLRDGEFEYTISLSSATEWERISDGYNELTRGLAEREQAIREREQQLEVLNRVLRHNLQNDMNVIIGHAEMLPRYTDDERVENASETIVRMGEELVSHGQKARQLEAAMGSDEATVTLDAVDVVETVADQYGEVVTVEAPESAHVDVTDAFELAVENLVENAVEHNDSDDPTVEIGVERRGDTVTITVADDGPGIPAHEYEVLEDGAETALQHGSGVGLWLAHWVIERADGQLSFDDRTPRGSIVTVEVPTAESAVAQSDR